VLTRTRLSPHLQAALGPSLVIFVVYLSTMGYGFSEGDHAELQIVPPITGIAHEPGYGCWALMGKVFLLVPGLTPAARINLMTVTFATGAVFVLVFLASVWSGSPWLGACVGLVLGVSRYAWVNAVLAEVYAPQTFFLLTVFTLVIYPEIGDLPDPWPCWKWASFIGGWAVGFRPDTVLLMGPCSLYVLWRCWKLGIMGGLPVLIKALVMGAAPSYLYLIAADILVNHPANIYNVLRPYFSVGYDLLPETWSALARPNADVILNGNWFDRFWWLYTCQSVRWFYSATTWADGWIELRKFCVITFQQLGPVTILLALSSIRFRDFSKRLPEMLGWSVICLYLYSYSDLATTIQEFFYPPLWAFLCCFAALGASRLPDFPVPRQLFFKKGSEGQTSVIPSGRPNEKLMTGTRRRKRFRWVLTDGLRATCVCLLLATAGYEAYRNYGVVCRFSDEEDNNQTIRAIFNRVPSNAVILSIWGPLNALLYAHYIEGLGQGVTLISVPEDANLEVCERFARVYPERPLFLYRSAGILQRFVPGSEEQPCHLEESSLWAFGG
jgi:hypothetical protein